MNDIMTLSARNKWFILPAPELDMTFYVCIVMSELQPVYGGFRPIQPVKIEIYQHGPHRPREANNASLSFLFSHDDHPACLFELTEKGDFQDMLSVQGSCRVMFSEYRKYFLNHAPMATMGIMFYMIDKSLGHFIESIRGLPIRLQPIEEPSGYSTATIQKQANGLIAPIT